MNLLSLTRHLHPSQGEVVGVGKRVTTEIVTIGKRYFAEKGIDPEAVTISTKIYKEDYDKESFNLKHLHLRIEAKVDLSMLTPEQVSQLEVTEVSFDLTAGGMDARVQVMAVENQAQESNADFKKLIEETFNPDYLRKIDFVIGYILDNGLKKYFDNLILWERWDQLDILSNSGT